MYTTMHLNRNANDVQNLTTRYIVQQIETAIKHQASAPLDAHAKQGNHYPHRKVTGTSEGRTLKSLHVTAATRRLDQMVYHSELGALSVRWARPSCMMRPSVWKLTTHYSTSTTPSTTPTPHLGTNITTVSWSAFPRKAHSIPSMAQKRTLPTTHGRSASSTATTA